MSPRLPLFALLCLTGYCHRAGADHCDLPVESERTRNADPSDAAVLAKTRLETAGFRNARGQGSYQSMGLELAYRQTDFSVWATLPAYRLRRENSVELGMGDAILGAQLNLLRVPEDEDWVLRVFGAVSLPSGDAERELGMGHVMILPRIEAGRHYRSLSLVTWLGAGLATETHGAHETHGEHGPHEPSSQDPPHKTPGPIVSPMNPFEIHWGARARVTLWDRLLVSAKLFAAQPIIEVGQGRITAGGLIGLFHPRFIQEFEFEAPVASDPFVFRTALNLGYRF